MESNRGVLLKRAVWQISVFAVSWVVVTTVVRTIYLIISCKSWFYGIAYIYIEAICGVNFSELFCNFLVLPQTLLNAIVVSVSLSIINWFDTLIACFLCSIHGFLCFVASCTRQSTFWSLSYFQKTNIMLNVQCIRTIYQR
jgi:hypothetical protein